MVNFDELENKIRQSRASYSFTDDGKGRKTYTIFSEELKQSLRDTIHSTAQAGEWQINHSTGTNFIKYRKQQDDKFGFYQKTLAQNFPDELTVFSGSQTSTEKKEFEEANRNIAESKREMEEHQRQMEEHQRQIAESGQIIEDSRRQIESSQQQVNQGQNFPRSGEGAYISVSGDERVIREAFEILARQQREREQQQAQIRHGGNLKLSF
jgi:hypothetical protein